MTESVNQNDPIESSAAAESARETLNRQQVHQVISNRLSQWRAKAWEDDISRHSLDTAPFENLPPISQRLVELRLESSANVDRLIPKRIQEQVDLRAMAQKDTLPIPSPADREGYSPGFDGSYWLSGLADYLKIMDAAKQYDVHVDTFFDFGCASGRVIRHFAIQSEVRKIWGSDINARHIRWLAEFMPQNVVPIANHSIPALPIADDAIDAISAFSVFTHIDTFETCWLAELRRVLRPGGMAYLTVHNEDTWEVLRDEIENPDNRLLQSMIQVDPETPRRIMGAMPDTRSVYRFTDLGPYRAQVFHSNNYLRKVWGRFFDIVEILPRYHVRQSVVIMMKPLNPTS